eukprot:CAMPEP_0119052948 /NCGR_PEP_ID=MMETSP1177-20130426/74080_1 /TAXON_ID=2985 /ORGANISM="Ochromonas sp, Strain CCMP1899" /LENGTH=448 /DNA_ID=CAMNT_0007032699 /DNA_START=527 /DNA_END=1873 /DNA_ORIENTATION=+
MKFEVCLRQLFSDQLLGKGVDNEGCLYGEGSKGGEQSFLGACPYFIQNHSKVLEINTGVSAKFNSKLKLLAEERERFNLATQSAEGFSNKVETRGFKPKREWSKLTIVVKSGIFKDYVLAKSGKLMSGKDKGDKSGNEQDRKGGHLPYELMDCKGGLLTTDSYESTQLSPFSIKQSQSSKPLTPLMDYVTPLILSKDDATFLNESDIDKEDDMIKISSIVNETLSQSSQSMQSPLAPHISLAPHTSLVPHTSISSPSLPSFLPSSLEANDAEVASQSVPSILPLLDNVDLTPSQGLSSQPPSNVYPESIVNDKLSPKDNQTDDSKGFFKLLNNCRIRMDNGKTLQEEESGGGKEIVKKLSMRIRVKPGSFSNKGSRNESFSAKSRNSSYIAVSDLERQGPSKSRNGSGSSRVDPQRRHSNGRDLGRERNTAIAITVIQGECETEKEFP